MSGKKAARERSVREIAMDLAALSDDLRRSTYVGGVTAEMILGWARVIDQATIEMDIHLRRLTYVYRETDGYKEA